MGRMGMTRVWSDGIAAPVARHRVAQGRIAEVQVYTVARKPSDSTVGALSSEELEGIAAAARAAGLNARAV